MIRVLWLILWKSSVINLLLISQYYPVLGITVPPAQRWAFQSLTRTSYSKGSLGLWHQWYRDTVVEPLVWQGVGSHHHWSCLCCILAFPCPTSFPSIFPSDSALPPFSILTKSKLSRLSLRLVVVTPAPFATVCISFRLRLAEMSPCIFDKHTFFIGFNFLEGTYPCYFFGSYRVILYLQHPQNPKYKKRIRCSSESNTHSGFWKEWFSWIPMKRMLCSKMENKCKSRETLPWSVVGAWAHAWKGCGLNPQSGARGQGGGYRR